MSAALILSFGATRCRALGLWPFHRGDIPETELEYVEPGVELPGGLFALYDGLSP
jgi:hypothetical protein